MRKTTLVMLIAVFSLIAFSLAACGGKGGPTEVHVKLSEFKIEMDKTSIPAGPVKFIIDNTGKEKHEVVLEPANVNDQPFESGGKESEAEDIEPGASATLEWTIDQPGDYQLGCHVNENNEDHYALGMVTTFTVTKP
ncbi:MAG TPA: cupredoxin domain-containing protein [Anaerolineales bacterium]|nr:cupredoxin domain-containing protein [Anaerolineales bacterium]